MSGGQCCWFTSLSDREYNRSRNPFAELVPLEPVSYHDLRSSSLSFLLGTDGFYDSYSVFPPQIIRPSERGRRNIRTKITGRFIYASTQRSSFSRDITDSNLESNESLLSPMESRHDSRSFRIGRVRSFLLQDCNTRRPWWLEGEKARVIVTFGASCYHSNVNARMHARACTRVRALRVTE